MALGYWVRLSEENGHQITPTIFWVLLNPPVMQTGGWRLVSKIAWKFLSSVRAYV